MDYWDDKYIHDGDVMKSTSAVAGGEPLTFAMLQKTLADLPARMARDAKREETLIQALNLDIKMRWAKSRNKTVEQLTTQDLDDLSAAMFKAWLKYKGIREEEL